MTAAVLCAAFEKFLAHLKNNEPELKSGKQTLRDMMKHNTALSSMEINHDNIKAFENTAKKYHIDFALKKDTSQNPPGYLVFFKGRDIDVMTMAFKEFTHKHLTERDEPGIIKILHQAKEKSAERSHAHQKEPKQRNRQKKRERAI